MARDGYVGRGRIMGDSHNSITTKALMKPGWEARGRVRWIQKKEDAMSEVWRPIEEFDHDRRSRCRIRLACCGREIEAIWCRIRMPGSPLDGARMWLCKDNEVRGLYDVSEFIVVGSTLPFGSRPYGECTDAELLADEVNT
jgi:hypothetical protein